MLPVMVAACRFTDSGTQSGDLDAAVADTPFSDRGRIETIRPDGDDGPETGVEGGARLPPAVAGCSDGTREGFVDIEHWSEVAACAGGWSVPGLVGEGGQKPACLRRSGNSGELPAGEGCAAADLCAEGWHVCRSGDEIATRSLSNCEGATASGADLFFAVRAGASPAGVCTPEKSNTNNLYGCGSFGGAADSSCGPLDRLLGFAECGITANWRCGDASDWQREAAVVTKLGPELGGVLCCRD